MSERVQTPTIYHENRVGYDTYDRVRIPHTQAFEPVLPAEQPVAHAVHHLVMKFRRESKHPDFLESYRYMTARCGSVVKVLLPLMFDEQDPDACPRCVQAIAENRPTPTGRRW